MRTVNGRAGDTPVVSICLPVLNGRRFLEDRLASIIAQTFTDWELVVCDSYSDDGSWELLQQYAADTRITLRRVPREGVYAGWNECLKCASGRYIHVATADDTVSPDFLEKLVAMLEQHQDVDLAVCQFDFTDASGTVTEPPRRCLDRVYGKWLDVPHLRPSETEILIHLCLGGIPWTTAGALVFRRSLLDKTGMFRRDLGPRADMPWALRASLHSGTISLPDKMATFRQHPDQASTARVSGWGRKNLRAKEGILEELSDRVPDEWKRHDDWRARLLWKPRQDYLAGFGLDRKNVRERPWSFMVGMSKALVKEPAYLFARLQSRFSWESAEFSDEYEYFWGLIKEWQIDWEPNAL